MKCIIGLGNPGKKYDNTRHNIGFMVIDELLRRHHWQLDKNKFKGSYALEHFSGDKIILLKPETYMNLSGESIRPLMDFYQIERDDIAVIYDDLDLPTGKIRLREKGGHGGHNGIRSTIDHLGTKEFKRIRLGVGRPPAQMSVVDYVLGRFQKNEEQDVESSIKQAADAVEAWFTESFVDVMSRFNQKA